MTRDLVVRNIGRLVTPAGRAPRLGPELGGVREIPSADSAKSTLARYVKTAPATSMSSAPAKAPSTLRSTELRGTVRRVRS